MEELIFELKGLRRDNDKYTRMAIMEFEKLYTKLRDIELKLDELGRKHNEKTADSVKDE